MPVYVEILARAYFELEKAKKWVDQLGLEWAMKAIKHHESHLGMTFYESGIHGPELVGPETTLTGP